jgi:sulfate/thiosulfate-binding protein
MLSKFFSFVATSTVAATLFLSSSALRAADITLHNVSYDPTRELYKQINKAFSSEYQKQTGDTVTIKNSHGGSGKQARSVIDGAPADVVTLALAADIDAIAQKAHLLPDDWQAHLPDNSAPYTSTIVFLVRKGNPKAIHDWNDLVKPDVKIITPDPKSSGGARWAYLAAWGQALKANDNDETKAQAYVADLYHHVQVLDSGSRAATVTFAQRGQGDVLLGWENEAYLAIQEFGDKFEVIAPKVSILAEPCVAVVEKNAEKNGTAKAAEAYLKFLYTPEAQKIVARNFYRPRDPDAVAAATVPLPKLDLFTVADFGGWSKVQAKHFADRGVFDQITRK